MYEIGMALKNIKRNFFVYFLLTLEITIAIAFITSSINAEKSAIHRKEILKKQFGTDSIVFRHFNLTEDVTSEHPFNHDDFEFIQQKINNDVSMNCVYNTFIFNKNKITNFSIVFTTKLDINKKKAIIGKELMDELDFNEAVSDEEIIQIKDNKLYCNQQSFQISMDDIYEDSKYLTIDLGIEDVDLRKSIILPLEVLNTKNVIGNVVIHSPSSKNIQDVLSYLQKKHSGKYTYKYYNLLHSLEQSIKDFNTELYFLKQVSYIMILQLIFGFSGIIMLFINNNKRSIAIKMAVGASRLQIILELFLEISFFCILGLILGSILGGIIIHNLGKTTNVIRYSYYSEAYILAFITILAISIISIIPVCFKILKMSPHILLSDY